MSEAGWATKDKIQASEVFTVQKKCKLNILSFVPYLQNNPLKNIFLRILISNELSS